MVSGDGEDAAAAAMRTVSVRDSAVVARGVDEHGQHALAVWQVNQHGVPTGAHIVPDTELSDSPEVARRLLSVLERRAVTAHIPQQGAEIVEQLTTTAKIDAGAWWEQHLFDPVTCFRELVARREQYNATISHSRTPAGNKPGPVHWKQDFSGSEPSDVDSLHALANRVVPPASPVATEALAVCAVLRWLSELWNETEQVKIRRDYVAVAHGAPQELPPSWLAAVHHADETRLPL